MKRFNRIIAGALAAAIAVTCVEVVPAAAANAKTKVTSAQQEPVTDLSARRRYRGNNAAAIAAFAAIAGTIASVAAAEQRRQEWEDYHRYGYYGGYGGYAPYPYRHHRQYWQGW